jgi:hypothetical protein
LRAPGMGRGGGGQQSRRDRGGEEQGMQGFHAGILAGRRPDAFDPAWPLATRP